MPMLESPLQPRMQVYAGHRLGASLVQGLRTMQSRRLECATAASAGRFLEQKKGVVVSLSLFAHTAPNVVLPAVYSTLGLAEGFHFRSAVPTETPCDSPIPLRKLHLVSAVCHGDLHVLKHRAFPSKLQWLSLPTAARCGRCPNSIEKLPER